MGQWGEGGGPDFNLFHVAFLIVIAELDGWLRDSYFGRAVIFTVTVVLKCFVKLLCCVSLTLEITSIMFPSLCRLCSFCFF